jgi:hypothetical protein
MSYQLVVLAAGLGTRFGGDKQLEPVGPDGETLMDYAIFDAAAAGVQRVVFVVRREHEGVFREQITRRYAARLEIAFAFQELDDLPSGFTVPPGRRKPWGTGHAVWAARHAVDGPFATINADDFYGAAGFRRLADFFSAGISVETPAEASVATPAARPARWALVTYELGNTLSQNGTVSRGVCDVDQAGHLRGIREVGGIEAVRGLGKTDAGLPRARSGERSFSGREPVSMNLWGLTPAVFAPLEAAFREFLAADATSAELYLPAVIDREIAAGRAEVRALSVPDRWIGMTHPADRAAVVEALAAAPYPRPLWCAPST